MTAIVVATTMSMPRMHRAANSTIGSSPHRVGSEPVNPAYSPSSSPMAPTAFGACWYQVFFGIASGCAEAFRWVCVVCMDHPSRTDSCRA
jgi:hypothetical protein